MWGSHARSSIVVMPMFGAPYEVKVDQAKGGHGGGDAVMLEDIFGNPPDDRFKRAAGAVQGAMSILTGIAANKAIAGGMPVKSFILSFHSSEPRGIRVKRRKSHSGFV